MSGTTKIKAKLKDGIVEVKALATHPMLSYQEAERAKKEVNFIGDAQKRIQEDYLRIIRYYRFFAKINASVNQNNSNIIKQNLDGLTIISKERILCELNKMLVYKNWQNGLNEMIKDKVSHNI